MSVPGPTAPRPSAPHVAPRGPSTPELLDFGPAADDFLGDVLAGLSQPRKRLPCKYFYDARGSRLFDRICELPEYYQTRTELAILRAHAGDVARLAGPRARLVEYGSGSSLKTRVLLDALRAPTGYVPIDISRRHLLQAARALAADYPRLAVRPVCADYTARFELPRFGGEASRTVVFFPGSTIGNFDPDDARAFLAGVRVRAGSGAGLLIGVDLKKDPARLHAAYNDSAGVTAEFNRNLLVRIDRELDGDLDAESFWHHACYEPRLGRIEMHLVSRRARVAHVAGRAFRFGEGESIFTESSWKYAPAEFEALATTAGWRVEQAWTDPERLFGVQFLTAT